MKKESILELMEPATNDDEDLDENLPDINYQKLLYKAFDLLNENVFNNELPPIEIFADNIDGDNVLFVGRRESNALGFFSFGRDGDKLELAIAFNVEANDCEKKWLSSDLVINTLWHELIHYYCYINKIKDVRKDHNYHTRKFKKTCERFCGSCEYRNTYRGYTDACLNREILSKLTAALESCVF